MSYVYVIMEEGREEYLKIGFSKNPEKRLIALQTSNPRTLTILKKIKGDEAKEKYIHSQLSNYHVKGEWFKNNSKVRSFLKVSIQCKKEISKQKSFILASGIYELMKKMNVVSFDAKDYCNLRRLDFDYELIQKAFRSIDAPLRLEEMEYEYAGSLIGYVGHKFNGKKWFFISAFNSCGHNL